MMNLLPRLLQALVLAGAIALPTPALAIFASPIQAGCYVVAPGQCRIHADPFTINLASGKKLVFFQLVLVGVPGGPQTVVYSFRPDQSNPVPSSGSTYTPTSVAQDFAATCGSSYQLSLQGQDTGDANAFNLGLTGTIACPATAP